MENFCNDCHKFFSSKFNLKRHRSTKHPEMSSDESSSEMEQLSSKRHRLTKHHEMSSDESDSEIEETTSTTSEPSSNSEDSDSENSCFNTYDYKMLDEIKKLREKAGEMTTYQIFERLLLFFKCIKRSVSFKAIHEKAEMIKAESNFMSLNESLRAALIFRQFLIGKLFKDDNSESDCET